MTWTDKQLERIPEVYRDFLLALRPVVDSEDEGAALNISGIPAGQVFHFLRLNHGYEPREIDELYRNLAQQQLVERDKWGFYYPTDKGKALIRRLVRDQAPMDSRVPALPEL